MTVDAVLMTVRATHQTEDGGVVVAGHVAQGEIVLLLTEVLEQDHVVLDLGKKNKFDIQ